MKLAAVTDQKRFVVGDELGQQAGPEKRTENDQRPESAPVAAEVAPAALVQGDRRISGPSAFKVDARIDENIHQITEDPDHKPDQTEKEQRGEDDRIIALKRRLEAQPPQTIE